MLSPKVKIGQILERKKREDPIGLLSAQREGTMADFLAADLRAGIIYMQICILHIYITTALYISYPNNLIK